VWLLAEGGVLFLAFPHVLASGLSGFYLAIFLVLWVLILRGVSIELRSHVADGMWRGFWDACFAVASILAPILLGAALGNLIRGVPLRDDGYFTLALFDSFSPTGALGILDWYTVLAGVFALAAIAHHGALFLAWKTGGVVRARAARAAAWIFPVVVVLWGVATAATGSVAPGVFRGLARSPLAWLATALFVAGLSASYVFRRSGRDLLAFLGSAAFLLGVLAATAASVYPTMIRAVPDEALSLTAWNAAASPASLAKGLLWWPPGFVLAVAYLLALFRIHRGKASADAYGTEPLETPDAGDLA
jgi:cytochrome d ubiquinol oxidase subunit II